jgi:hypothetical protein
MANIRELYTKPLWQITLVTAWWTFGAAMLIFALFSTAWDAFTYGPAAVWYSFKYRVRVDNVMAVGRPSDCDFLRAPIGYKGCHYERTVESWKDAGEPPRVLLGWNKVSD